MHSFSIIFTVASILLLSVLAAPLPFDQALDKRGEWSGRGTWFYDGLGACGHSNSNSDLIVAISAQIYDAGANCNQWVRVTDTETQQTEYATVADECEGCAPGDLDMSIGLFERYSNLNTGVLPITWDFMPRGWSPY